MTADAVPVGAEADPGPWLLLICDAPGDTSSDEVCPAGGTELEEALTCVTWSPFGLEVGMKGPGTTAVFDVAELGVPGSLGDAPALESTTDCKLEGVPCPETALS